MNNKITVNETNKDFFEHYHEKYKIYDRGDLNFTEFELYGINSVTNTYYSRKLQIEACFEKMEKALTIIENSKLDTEYFKKLKDDKTMNNKYKDITVDDIEFSKTDEFSMILNAFLILFCCERSFKNQENVNMFSSYKLPLIRNFLVSPSLIEDDKMFKSEIDYIIYRLETSNENEINDYFRTGLKHTLEGLKHDIGLFLNSTGIEENDIIDPLFIAFKNYIINNKNSFDIQNFKNFIFSTKDYNLWSYILSDDNMIGFYNNYKNSYNGKLTELFYSKYMSLYEQNKLKSVILSNKEEIELCDKFIYFQKEFYINNLKKYFVSGKYNYKNYYSGGMGNIYRKYKIFASRYLFDCIPTVFRNLNNYSLYMELFDKERYNNILNRLNKLIVKIYKIYIKNVKTYSPLLNKYINLVSKDSTNFWKNKLFDFYHCDNYTYAGRRIDRMLLLSFLKKIIEKDINSSKEIDVCKKYGITPNNLSFLLFQI